MDGILTLSIALREKTSPSPSVSFVPSASRPSFNRTLFNYSQQLNALAPTSLMLDGKMSSLIPLSAKHYLPIVSNPSGSRTSFRFLHPLKALYSIFLSVEGRAMRSTMLSSNTPGNYVSSWYSLMPSTSSPSFNTTLLRFWHLQNAPWWIIRTASGVVRLSSPLPSNAHRPISSSVLGSWTVFKFLQSLKEPYSILFKVAGSRTLSSPLPSKTPYHCSCALSSVPNTRSPSFSSAVLSLRH